LASKANAAGGIVAYAEQTYGKTFGYLVG